MDLSIFNLSKNNIAIVSSRQVLKCIPTLAFLILPISHVFAGEFYIGDEVVIYGDCKILEGPDKDKQLRDGMLVTAFKIDKDRTWISGPAIGWVNTKNLLSTKEAIQIWKEKLTANPNNIEDTANLAFFYFDNRQIEKAKQLSAVLVRARQKNQYANVIWMTISANTIGINKLKKEIKATYSDSKLEPYNAHRLLLLLIGAHEWELSRNLIQSCKTDPEDMTVDLLSDAAAISYSLGQPREAMRLLNAAIKKDALFLDARKQLAQIYRMEGQHNKSKKEIADCILLSPDCYSAHILMGDVLFEEGNLKLGLKSMRKAQSLATENALANYTLGSRLIYTQILQYGNCDTDTISEALGYLRKACEISNFHSLEYVQGLCIALAYAGDEEKAKSILDRCLSRPYLRDSNRTYLKEAAELVDFITESKAEE